MRFIPGNVAKCYNRLYLTAQQKRHGYVANERLEQLKGSDSEVSSAKNSVYRGQEIVVYLAEVVGFSLGAAEGYGTLVLDGNDQEEDSSIVWDDE